MMVKFDKSLASAVVLALLIGLAGGFFLWGRTKKPVDIKQLLRKALHEVEVLEKDYRETAEELRLLKEGATTLADLAEENRVLKEDLLIAQQDKKQLEQHIIQLKSEHGSSAPSALPGAPLEGAASDRDAPAGEPWRRELRALLHSALEKQGEVQAALARLKTDLPRAGTKKTAVDEYRARIASVEQELQALRTILESAQGAVPEKPSAPPGGRPTDAPPPGGRTSGGPATGDR